MEHLTSIFTFIAIIVGWGFSVWGVVKYLIDRTDKKMQVERDERLKSQNDMHQKIEHVKEKYVLREDYHRFMDDVKQQIGEMSKGINTRMDQLFVVLAGPTKKD